MEKTKTTYNGINIWVGNLRKYNEGVLCGEWVSLPTDKTSKEIFKDLNINLNTDEYYIADFEADFDIDSCQYDSIDSLNELAKRLETLDDYNFLLFKVYADNNYCTVEELLELVDYYFLNIQGYIYYNCNSMRDVAYQVVEDNCLLDSMSDNLVSYFDYDKYGRDLLASGNFVEFDDGFIEFVV